MSKLLVLQHTESEFLGLIEDHLEARRIGFQYIRPFADQGWQLKTFDPYAGLVLLGGGPWGSAGQRDLPSLAPEVELCARYLGDGLPVLGFGLGAQILARAGGGDSEAAPFEFRLVDARRADDDEAAQFLPEHFPMIRYGRDHALPPPGARILASDGDGVPLVFQLADNCFGFMGHPGAKSGIIEDLIMEFEESPENAIPQLQELRAAHGELERSLEQIMIGLIQRTGWMRRDGGA
ncbi:MAG: hypothetical protein HN478_03690 [Rhodospirillaceae bacterium]|jgi:GMP synthase-like glutamine amidotransferase|nr:hypothetical protein [Rhodospirillaceae bacterium]MBT4488674.1 hypothetical protein [Rhodospirillaceae bacterium]MBT5192360.1 hypothetical protein [Rhodospirillaceae bacterium]MBT6431202.1 hypothetical protein [Rhodospirillaceae bacterium]MBT7756843.1 hypothetical protein [Rhodospirillaceae bacterium]